MTSKTALTHRSKMTKPNRDDDSTMMLKQKRQHKCNCNKKSCVLQEDGSRRRRRRRADSLMLSLSLFVVSLLATLQIGSHIQLASASGPVQSVLLDTTEQSSLGWTKYPDGGPQTRTPGWVEESFTNFERGINWRSFVVCDVAFDSVNNWLWTPFIERGDANRLTIEIKFTMRDCNLFPQVVRSCKETFALLYKETDAPLDSQQQHQHHLSMAAAAAAANASFAQSDSYTLVDAIAADGGRFTSDTDVIINTEIRSVPVSKRGVYFAFRDQGACLSLISIKVYYVHCPELVTAFARFNATPTGRDPSSLVAVDGECVANSALVERPRMFCSASGQWTAITSGQCKCLPGYEPAANATRCAPCPPGRYKWAPGADSTCAACPERSVAPAPGAAECRCLDNYFRSPRDSRAAACSQPPGAAHNLSAVYVDSTSVVLAWQAPRFTGYREDLVYKLACDQCDQPLVSSPPQALLASSPSGSGANFSETKCVLAGLQPATTYRFVLHSMNGVSALAPQSPAHTEIVVQTPRAAAQTAANTLSSGLGAFQPPLPIYNFRAIPGARGSDMVLAWDAQSFQQMQQQQSAGLTESTQLLGAADSLASLLGASDGSSGQQQLPILYEIRFQPRSSLGDTTNAMRRSPYPASLVAGEHPATTITTQSVTTTNRALAISTLQPRTEYAFQIRAKWSHSSQWTDWSEPVYQATTNQVPSQQQLASANPDPFSASFPVYPFDLPFATPQQQQQLPALNQMSASPAASGGGGGNWLATFALVLLCALVSLAVISVTLIHYRKSMFMQSLGANFSHLGGQHAASAFATGGDSSGPGSTYGGAGGIYGNGFLTGGGGGGAFAAFPSSHLHAGTGAHTLSQHHATMSASSAGGLITGSNATSRSSSGGGGGAASVVQNFIAATLSQISGGHANSHPHGQANKTLAPSAGAQHHLHHHHQLVAGGHTLAGLLDGKQLFASEQQSVASQHQRNHYHQTLGNHGGHTILPAANGFQLQQQPAIGQQQQRAADDLFKCRTMGQQAGAQVQFVHQQDPQLHIYDDLDNTCTTITGGQQQQHGATKEIEPQRVTIESVIGRGEFGDVCLAKLRSPLTGAESRVAVKTLKAQAGEKAKLDFLVEASIMSQLGEHPNIIHLEGIVAASEPFMIVTEFMENGSLDSYLRENKNRFTCLQLISMLRGIANGMQYLAQLNYVHKDLAARNILVNGQNVCKIADFGLSAHQLESTATSTSAQTASADNYTATTTDSSTSTSSSQTSGGTPTTASTLAGGSGNLSQLHGVAEQIARQRFALQQQLQQHQGATMHRMASTMQQQQQQNYSIQNPKIPVRWTALEAIAFRRFTSASDVWSFGVVCWEVMSEGERPYWNWSNQDVIKAVEQGYRLPQPEGCPEQLYKLMLDCWLKDRGARPTFAQLVKSLDRLLSPYDDPFSALGQCQPPAQHQGTQLVPTRISNQEAAYYDTYDPISQLINTSSSGKSGNNQQQQQPVHLKQQLELQPSVDEWLSSIKMSRYKENFQRHQINSLQYVLRLSQTDLNHVGIQNSQHVKKIVGAIQALRSTTSIGASGEGYLV